MDPDQTERSHLLTAVLPLAEATPWSIGSFVRETMEEASRRGVGPSWTLPEANAPTSRELRRRRMGLLFMLALPGHVHIDVHAESALQQEHAHSLYSPGSIIRDAMGSRDFFRCGASSFKVLTDWNDRGRWWQPGLVVTHPTTNSGVLNIGNFTDSPRPLPDGSIVVASDDPQGPFDATSDNDMLPALTTIWLAAK